MVMISGLSGDSPREKDGDNKWSVGGQTTGRVSVQ